MRLPKNLLVAVMAMGVLGSARAEVVAQVLNPYAPVPSDSGFYFAPGDPTPYSFADIVNLPRGAGPRLLTSGTDSRVPGGTLAELSNVSDATPMRSAGANVAGSLLGAILTLNDDMDDLSAAVVPDKVARRSATDWHTGAGFLFSTAEIPEPADWMTLLCGLVVVAFIARRKSGSIAD
jgi:hypothetical protein